MTQPPKNTATRPSRRTSVLITLAVLFALAFSGRIAALSADEANNQPDKTAQATHPEPTTPEPTTPEPTTHAQNTLESGTLESGTQPHPLDQLCLTADAARLVQKTQTDLEEKQARLDQRAAELAILEKKLRDENQRLQSLEDSLEQRWGLMQESANSDLTHLARMYEAMKPDKAAAIFNKMDHEFAAGFLRLMKSEQAALIMANMSADAAYLVSVTIANQNSDIRNNQNNNIYDG